MLMTIKKSKQQQKNTMATSLIHDALADHFFNLQ